MNGTNTLNLKRRIPQSCIPNEQSQVIATYPSELTNQFQPLHCILCNIHLTSTTNAKMHYNSRNHKKKVNKYIEEWSQNTGEPMPKKLTMDNSKQSDELHCDICHLKLTSSQHAQQHYMGKAHQMVSQGKRNPPGSGYYKDGKWIKCATTVYDPSGRYGIGSGFASSVSLKNECAETSKEVLPSASQNTNLYCSICDCHVTSPEQMGSHIIGSRHKKKLKQLGHTNIALDDDYDAKEEIVLNPPVDNILSSVLNSTHKSSLSNVLNNEEDISIFRTPSGNFYCKPCNWTLLNETQFKNHVQSKKHIKHCKSIVTALQNA